MITEKKDKVECEMMSTERHLGVSGYGVGVLTQRVSSIIVVSSLAYLVSLNSPSNHIRPFILNTLLSGLFGVVNKLDSRISFWVWANKLGSKNMMCKQVAQQKFGDGKTVP